MTLPTLLKALALACCGLSVAQAAELRVLSAGAIEPGLRPAVTAFEQASGHTVLLSFATAPQIRERVAAGAAFDLVIAPPAVLDDLESAARLAPARAQRVSIGRVGLGVAVRPGAPRPDIATPEAFTRALVEADSLVFNRASTGLYVETLLTRLGIEAQAKSTRYPDGASVMAHVLRGQGREIGLGAITEILLVRDQGLQFVGPLPAALQNYTAYVAAPARGDPGDAARAMLQHLAGARAQSMFADAGIELTR